MEERTTNTSSESVESVRSLKRRKVAFVIKHLRQSRFIAVGMAVVLTCLVSAGLIEIYLRVFLPPDHGLSIVDLGNKHSQSQPDNKLNGTLNRKQSTSASSTNTASTTSITNTTNTSATEEPSSILLENILPAIPEIIKIDISTQFPEPYQVPEKRQVADASCQTDSTMFIDPSIYITPLPITPAHIDATTSTVSYEDDEDENVCSSEESVEEDMEGHDQEDHACDSCEDSETAKSIENSESEAENEEDTLPTGEDDNLHDTTTVDPGTVVTAAREKNTPTTPLVVYNPIIIQGAKFQPNYPAYGPAPLRNAEDLAILLIPFDFAPSTDINSLTSFLNIVTCVARTATNFNVLELFGFKFLLMKMREKIVSIHNSRDVAEIRRVLHYFTEQWNIVCSVIRNSKFYSALSKALTQDSLIVSQAAKRIDSRSVIPPITFDVTAIQEGLRASKLQELTDIITMIENAINPNVASQINSFLSLPMFARLANNNLINLINLRLSFAMHYYNELVLTMNPRDAREAFKLLRDIETFSP